MWEASQALGARSASIHGLYEARARGEVHGFTVPALNIRAQTFDMARTFYETAARADVGTLILELARSEQTYTFQRPMDYATSILAGAIAAGWTHPVFIQGDHYQFNAKKYATDPEAMTEEIRRACRLAIDAGYRNIDIDSSTLVDLSQADRDAEQRENYLRAAELTALIRGLETDGVTVSVGGEIGEVGKVNSTPDELRAYLDGYNRELATRAPGATGLSKVSVQTGTSHGGVPLPGGGVATVKLDFEVLRELGEIARVVRPRGRGPARRLDPARRAVPPLPGGRDGGDPPRDRVPEHALRAPGVPARAARPDQRLVRRQRRGRAQGRPDRGAVPVHDPQEGDRAVQAAAVGPRDEGRDPRGAVGQGRLPVHRAARERLAGAGQPVRASRRGPSAAAGGPPGRGRGLTPWAPRPARRTRTPGCRRSPSGSASRRRATWTACAPSSWPRSPGPEEAEIVDRIRREAPEGWLSLVAVGGPGSGIEDLIVGHLLLSPCPVEDDDGEVVATVLAIGPVAVVPEVQFRGIGIRAHVRRDEPRGRPGGARRSSCSGTPRTTRGSGSGRRATRASSRRPTRGRTRRGWPACCRPGATTMRGTVRYPEAFEPLACSRSRASLHAERARRVPWRPRARSLSPPVGCRASAGSGTRHDVGAHRGPCASGSRIGEPVVVGAVVATASRSAIAARRVARLPAADRRPAAGAVDRTDGLADPRRHRSSGGVGDARRRGRALIVPASVPASRRPRRGGRPRRPARVDRPPPATTPVPVLVGAGDIGVCDTDDDEDTAPLVETCRGSCSRSATTPTTTAAAATTGTASARRGAGSRTGSSCPCRQPRVRDRRRRRLPRLLRRRGRRDGATWYSTDIGAWHVVVLDSTCTASRAAATRTRRRSGGCATTSPRMTLGAPSHCSTIRGSAVATTATTASAPFWDALYEAGADLILNGHDHDYERFAPQDPQGAADEERGIMELVVGTGGADMREFHDPIANSRVQVLVAHGVVQLRLNPNGWRWQFHPTDDSFIDAGAGGCH